MSDKAPPAESGRLAVSCRWWTITTEKDPTNQPQLSKMSWTPSRATHSSLPGPPRVRWWNPKTWFRPFSQATTVMLPSSRVELVATAVVERRKTRVWRGLRAAAWTIGGTAALASRYLPGPTGLLAAVSAAAAGVACGVRADVIEDRDTPENDPRFERHAAGIFDVPVIGPPPDEEEDMWEYPIVREWYYKAKSQFPTRIPRDSSGNAQRECVLRWLSREMAEKRDYRLKDQHLHKMMVVKLMEHEDYESLFARKLESSAAAVALRLVEERHERT